MNRCNAMPETISIGLVLQQRLGSDEWLVAWKQERRLVVEGSKNHILAQQFLEALLTLSSFLFPSSTHVLNFDHFSCLFVWSVSSRASGATVATKEKIRRPRDVV